MPRELFALRTRPGRSTADKLLVGSFSDKTLAVVEGGTGVPLRPRDDTSEGRTAPAAPPGSRPELPPGGVATNRE